MIELKDIVGARLAELHRGPGTAERIGGLGKNYVSDIVRGEKRDIRTKYLPKLAKALDWSVDELRAHGVGAASPADLEAALEPQTNAVASGKDLPILGIAAGSLAGSFLIGQPIDWIRRPAGLSHTANAYALYVDGASMAPKYEPGDLILVNPDRPAAPGDIVVIITKNFPTDAPQAWLKILVRVTGDKIVVRQINPASTIQYTRDQVVGIHRVLKTSEMLGA